MNRRRSRAAVLAGLLLAMALPSGVATADASFVDVVGGNGPIHLMPGSQSTVDFVVHNESSAAGSLSVSATDVTEDDEGCVRSERDAGDVTCGDGGGELGQWLELRLMTVDGSATHEAWAGTVQDLAHAAPLLTKVAGGDAPHLRLEVSLPRDAGNDTMSDRTTFALRWTWTADLVDSQTSVLGVQQGTPGPGGSASLPSTGSAISPGFLGTLTALLGIGAILAVAGRRRRRTAPGT
jgi:hypothetical protein